MNQKRIKWKRPSAGRAGRWTVSEQQKVLRILLKSFLGGGAIMLVLFAAGALAFAELPLPGDLVRPTACTIAGLGAVLSGAILAHGFGRMRILCGLGSGAFYSLCIVGASLWNGGFVLEQRGIALISMLLLAGMLGGVLTAIKPSGQGIR